MPAAGTTRNIKKQQIGVYQFDNQSPEDGNRANSRNVVQKNLTMDNA
jgi:hypothetical protein